MKKAEKFIDVLTCEDNVFVPLSTVFREFDSLPVGKWVSFYGAPCLQVSGGVIVFKRCEYCHTTEIPTVIEGIAFCSRCQAPQT